MLMGGEEMDAFALEGRVALVTGGNGGIGLGMARGLLDAGATVLIVGRNAAKNNRAVQELSQPTRRVKAIEVDIALDGGGDVAVKAAIDSFGRLDILINNAGTNIRKQPQDYGIAEWRMLIDTNLTSVFLCSKAAYTHMRSTGGKIINIGSMTSLFGTSFSAAYGASKGGIVQLTKALASAWAKDNIQVNAVLPGWIDTDLTRGARKDVTDLHDKVLARTPAGRWGVPSDLAGVAIFLASKASDFITGAAIPVDGGYSAQG
jgi:2-dehydro-3-deoxy-D-gluconate 5-dehydrogenase